MENVKFLAFVREYNSSVVCPEGWHAFRPRNWVNPTVCLPKELNIMLPLDEALDDYCSQNESIIEYLAFLILLLFAIVSCVLSCYNCCRVSLENF